MSSWHVSRAGERYGPYEWGDMAAWARDGRLAPDDLVWQQGLPGWMPAQQVPGLFAPTAARRDPAAVTPAPAPTTWPAPAYAPAARLPSRDKLWAILLPTAAGLLVGAAVGIILATGVLGGGKGDPVLVETPMRGPTVIDVPYESHELMVSPEGGRMEFRGAEILVPEGAVGTDTTLEIKALTGDFNISSEVSPNAEYFAIGPAIDFGPEGTVFDKPVTISVPYDESLVPSGIPEENIGLAYWNGEGWVTLPGLVDREESTVTVELSEFNGVVLEVILGVTILTTFSYAGHKVAKLYKGDPITNGTVAQWITPKDPAVVQAAGSATVGGVLLSDKKALAQYLLTRPLPKPEAAVITKPDGTTVDLDGRYSAGCGSNWMKPAEYFSTGTQHDGPLSGDCTDVANFMVSMFRSLGYPAKGMFGYDTTNSPHMWGEVLIGDKVYLIDEQGGLSDRDAAIKLQGLKRPDPSDSRCYMWDEPDNQGRQPQDPDWYKQYLTSTTTTTASDQTYSWIGTETLNGEKTKDIEAEFTLPAGEQPGGVQVRGASVDGSPFGNSYNAWQEKDGTIVVQYAGPMLMGKIEGNSMVLTSTAESSSGLRYVWELRKR